MVGQRYDVVVVGAGSSGAVVASRLSEDPARSVLLLEAGPDFPDEAVSPPAFLTGGNLLGEGFAGAGAAVPEHDWNYWSEQVSNGRRVHLRRGRLVGGTSMINGSVAVRGAPRDVEGFQELGFGRVPDMKAPDAWDGVAGAWPQNRRNEIRQGTPVTYVRAARPRPNFAIKDRTLVDCVLTEGSRARGLCVVDAAGRTEEIEAGAVVLSGGAYGTPATERERGSRR